MKIKIIIPITWNTLWGKTKCGLSLSLEVVFWQHLNFFGKYNLYSKDLFKVPTFGYEVMATLLLFLLSWQESHTANTAAFWSWSILSSGSSLSRSSLQSTTAAGLAGRLWRGALVSGSWKLKLSCSLFTGTLYLPLRLPLLLIGTKTKGNSFLVLQTLTYFNTTHFITFVEVYCFRPSSRQLQCITCRASWTRNAFMIAYVYCITSTCYWTVVLLFSIMSWSKMILKAV